MGKVSIQSTNNGISAGLESAISLIGGIGEFIGHDDRVMLKPNINSTDGITNIVLVEAVIKMLLEYCVKEIVIAESSFGTKQVTNIFFNKTGYTELAKKYSIKLINVNSSKIVKKKVKKPLIIDEIRIAKEVFEVDKIINLPVMKVHYVTAVTLSLKNMKGLLVRDEKRRFHEVGLNRAIADLNNTIRPTLNIVDCIDCMESMGPRGGDNVNMNLIMAGASCGEVDYIGARMMGFELEEVKHLKYFIQSNKININEIEVLGESLEGVKRNFKKVEMEKIIPKSLKIHDRDACCSCMNALLMSCQLLGRKPGKDINIYLGSKILEEDIVDGYKVAFGNCCTDKIEYDDKIKGCPPYSFDLKKILEK